VIRLDAPGEDYQPPPAAYTADLLCDAIDQAAAVTFPVEHGDQVVLLGFGTQIDRRSVHRDTIVATGKPLDAAAVANYIAKYATKTLHAPGVPDTRIRHASEITGLRCSAHYRAMITTAWELGARQATGDARFRQWAPGHQDLDLRRNRLHRRPRRPARARLRSTRPRAPLGSS
jgi:hypothetical protein